MSPTPLTPWQAAEAIYGLIPHAVSPATLEDYGIDATPEQAQQITRELLSLGLFWARWALRAALSEQDRKRVFGELRQCLVNKWSSELGQQGQDVQQFFEEVEARGRAYDQVMEEGASPVAIATEAAALAEADGVVRLEDRQKLLALFIDLVPVDELGEMATELSLT
ncbi:MAG: hypothetical protein HY581_06105 [Nitrospirae bacterium]|nr:hypothetical protein [Nitrospirota bacterium]